jgi:hypothetical protein
MISAGKNGIEMCVSGPKLNCQCRLDGMELIPTVVAPAYASLVCHHDNPNSQRIATGNCSSRARNQPYVLDAMKVMGVRDDHAIPIKEQRSATRRGRWVDFEPQAGVDEGHRGGANER